MAKFRRARGALNRKLAAAATVQFDATLMLLETLTSPVILFFLLGFLAAVARSDLTIPDAFAKAMSIYLMIAIGLKGGVEVAASGLSRELLMSASFGVVLSFGIPIYAFMLLRGLGGLDVTNAAAVSAHYGSVSVVTFVTAQALLAGVGLSSAGFIVAVLALMETPAIISGLWLAKRFGANRSDTRSLAHEVLLNSSVVLLLGSFVIGAIAGKNGFEPIKPLFQTGFRGVLCLFLLDMGLIAARRLMQTRSLTPRLIGIAILLPLLNGTLGTLGASLLGVAPANAAMLGVLAASASYIAVPAAMRLALPEADPGLYLSMALGVTFPFNLLVGISWCAALAQALG